ncbi:hypothetical protein PHSY_002955 [Pseudozyma hubeiensis SY62]|uniref:tRNA N(3)-methylcytidine methyltransferase n=1 Tax=Pseudozyma hubeiensis (strain SY62) TaxID=1305764 RepID=R9PBE7_PSEHS|nr:hypothetical protein PHSY_002955 [Pseudozyma hubeiensis SY62]GAC95380.1 hypothetical protein PHSY_002955 [Pseudozyma hubeiensis SY62]
MSDPPSAPAPHESLPIQPEVETSISSILAQNRRSATTFVVHKHSSEAAKNWDKFYKNHQDKFFKDRHWTNREFGSELASAGSSSAGKCKAAATEEDREEETRMVGEDLQGDAESVLLEVGCGVGNMLYPLLEGNASLKVHCCDFSARAVDMVKKHPLYDPERVNAFVYDLTSTPPSPSLSSFLSSQPSWPNPTTISLIFVLSAIPPTLHAHVLSTLRDILLPHGGHILFRDYAYGDLSQVRYHTKKDAAWAEPSLLSDDHHWYRRGDNTFNYFFQEEELRKLASKVGLEGEVETLRRTAVNRRSEVNMQRRFVQAKWYVEPRKNE